MVITHNNIMVGVPFQHFVFVADNGSIALINPPDWIRLSGKEGNNNYYTITAQEAGNFSASFHILNKFGQATGSGTITINAIDLFEYREICCNRKANIAWLNPYGGWSSYVFTGVKSYTLETGEVRKYQQTGILKTSKISDVYEGMQVTTGYIPKEDIDFTKSLRHTISAWLYNEETQKWDVPIWLKLNTFSNPLYQDKQKFFEFSFSFVYAKKLIVQTQ
jgi:hypothetical protein